MTEAVKIIAGKCETEASGGISRDQLNEIARTGVTYISAGALTHSAENIDLSFMFNFAPEEIAKNCDLQKVLDYLDVDMLKEYIAERFGVNIE